MPYFSSEYECKLDAKGRMVLPARLKAVLPPSQENTHLLVITRGFEPCLVLYPQSSWQKVFDQVAGLNEFNPEFRNFQRNFLRGNTEVELDANGRLLIPKTMLQYAGIDKGLILVGMGNRMELWNPPTYNQYLIKDPAEFSNLAQQFLANHADDRVS